MLWGNNVLFYLDSRFVVMYYPNGHAGRHAALLLLVAGLAFYYNRPVMVAYCYFCYWCSTWL